MKLETPDGEVIYINPTHVVAVEAADDEESSDSVVTTLAVAQDEEGKLDGIAYTVKGTVEEVAEKLGLT